MTNLKKTHSKMKKLTYNSLKMQSYLLSKELTKEEKISLFKWRVRMENFGENFRGKRDKVLCPICKDHEDSEEASISNCKILRDELTFKGNYESVSRVMTQILIFYKSGVINI